MGFSRTKKRAAKGWRDFQLCLKILKPFRIFSPEAPRLGGGFKYFLLSSLFGEDSILTNIFSNGLKPPTRRCQTILRDSKIGFSGDSFMVFHRHSFMVFSYRFAFPTLANSLKRGGLFGMIINTWTCCSGDFLRILP